MHDIEVPKNLIQTIEQNTAFFVIPHKDPDGDCVSSALALGHFLERLGKRVYMLNVGPFDKKEVRHWANRFEVRIDPALRQKERLACAIVVDCSTIDRIGELAEDIKGLPLLVIDHHSSGEIFGDIRLINSSSPSTSLLVQELIEAMGYTLDPIEAELLMYGFATDTGYFRHLDENCADALRLVARQVEAGISPKKLWYELNSGAALSGRIGLGRLLARTESYADGKVLLTWETAEETEQIGKKNRESDLLYQLLLGVEGVEVVISLREESPQRVNGGLRSRSYVDVGEIALKLGGGGHKRASGFQVEDTISGTKNRLLPLIFASL